MKEERKIFSFEFQLQRERGYCEGINQSPIQFVSEARGKILAFEFEV